MENIKISYVCQQIEVESRPISITLVTNMEEMPNMGRVREGDLLMRWDVGLPRFFEKGPGQQHLNTIV